MDYTVSLTTTEVSEDLDKLVARDEELVDRLRGWDGLQGVAGFTTDRAVGVTFDVVAPDILEAARMGLLSVRSILVAVGLPPDPWKLEVQIADED